MATYAVQFITRDGALCGQTITNRARAMVKVQDGEWGSGTSCVAIVVTANSTKERLRMKAQAVAQVFHERARAINWLKQIEEEHLL